MATADWFQTNLNIRFSEFNYYDSSSSEVSNRALFEDVRAIGQTSYEAYVSPVYLDNHRKPWRSTIKARAAHLSQYARQCLETQQNEIEWRLKLENEVTDRFDTEVNCSRCRAVIWRAEKDPTIATKFKTPRKDCHCKPRNKDDAVDDGLSRIFDFHADTKLVHDECIPLEHRKHPKPDRVYGLKKTSRISRLLQETPTPDGDFIGERVTSTPYREQHERLLFPFLVSECKSEQSSGSRSDAQKQSACAIITCLELQSKLAATVRLMKPNDESLKQKPLVWFLCNKGEQWSVAMASFCHERRPSLKYQVDNLWSGAITDPENALRLLLIMDYAFDWARDVYRKNIIDQLLALAANPTSTLAADTDMLTVVDGQPHDFCRDFDFTGYQPHREPLNERAYGIPDLFELFDVDHPTRAACRDARFMFHDVQGLDITADNLQELFQSLSKDPQEDRTVARKIQRAISVEHAWRVSAETLDAIEFLWTGFDREHGDLRQRDAKFLVNFAISSHLNPVISNGKKVMFREPCWRQRHTLQFVAVAETAIELLGDRSRYSKRAPIMNGLDVPKEKAVNLFEKIRFATVRQCLAAALDSVQRMTSRGFSGPSKGLWGDRPILDNVLRGHQTSELPTEVYHLLKTGRSEPEKSFLRLSQTPFQEQIVTKYDAFDWLSGERLISENDQVVFAYAAGKTANKEQGQEPSHCIFIIDPTRTLTDPVSHSSCEEVSEQNALCGDPMKQAQQQRMSIYKVSTASKVRRLASAENGASLEAVTSQDFDWFVEHINNEWLRMNQFIRCLEEGYYLHDLENLVKKIKLRYGPDLEGQHIIPTLVGIGISLGLRQQIKYLRDLTRETDLSGKEQLDKGKGKAIEYDQRSASSWESLKRNAAEDELDLPGPTKRPRSSGTGLEGCANPPTSPSSRSYITIEDEDEDRIVRLSLSSPGGTPSKTNQAST